MNYPVWDLFAYGGGFWIAFIAVVHVFVSHFAVGGGLWLVLTERKALKENDGALLAYVKGHSKFFLLLTMVFGGLTGVGIWWTIALLNPAATSVLIHTFVFGWATEWVCFLGEIVALFIYFYTFGRMRDREHQIIGWFYFVFAWLSLFLINGIIGFMLTPGGWLETGNFWARVLQPQLLAFTVFPLVPQLHDRRHVRHDHGGLPEGPSIPREGGALQRGLDTGALRADGGQRLVVYQGHARCPGKHDPAQGQRTGAFPEGLPDADAAAAGGHPSDGPEVAGCGEETSGLAGAADRLFAHGQLRVHP